METMNKQSSRKSREQLNDIEKIRTRRINSELLSLRNLLETSNVQSKKDKFSILSSTYDYIVLLKEKIKALDEELGGPDAIKAISAEGGERADGTLDFSKVVNYERIFTDGAAAMSLIALDGLLLHTNDALCSLTGFSREELSNMSIFHLCAPEEMESLFMVLGNMLTYPYQNVRHIWKKLRFRNREEECFLTMHLILQPCGEPGNIHVLISQWDETQDNNFIEEDIPDCRSQSQRQQSTHGHTSTTSCSSSTSNYIPYDFPSQQSSSHIPAESPHYPFRRQPFTTSSSSSYLADPPTITQCHARSIGRYPGSFSTSGFAPSPSSCFNYRGSMYGEPSFDPRSSYYHRAEMSSNSSSNIDTHNFHINVPQEYANRNIHKR